MCISYPLIAATFSAEADCRVEFVAEPFAGQPTGQLDADHALPEAQHLRVVAQDRPLHREAVVGGDGADAGHLVGADRDAQSGAADQQRSVGLAVGDQRAAATATCG